MKTLVTHFTFESEEVAEHYCELLKPIINDYQAVIVDDILDATTTLFETARLNMTEDERKDYIKEVMWYLTSNGYLLPLFE